MFELFVLLCYFCLWATGIWLIRAAYRIHFHREYRYVRDARNRPVENAQLVARPFAIMLACTGVGVLLLMIAIPLFHVPLKAWIQLLGLLAWSAALARHWISRKLQQPA